ncbi:MAG: hypothetical protein U5K75_09210 [Ahrensia sp.]|nr:hypothetical protein [Ahrensia sp.]
MKKLTSITAALILLSAGLSTHVYAQGTPFTVLVSKRTSCTVIVNRNGKLVPNAAKTVLSSKLVGGISGEALVTPQNGNYTVSANHYGIWRGSPEPTTAPNTTFQPSHSGTYRGSDALSRTNDAG